MTSVSWNQQTPRGVSVDQSSVEFQDWTWPTGFVSSQGSTAFQHGCAGFKLWASWGERYFTGQCLQSRGILDVHKQKWCLAPPQPHSQTRPWAHSGKGCSRHAPDVPLPAFAICAHSTARSPPTVEIDGSALITRDWSKYFILHLFLEGTDMAKKSKVPHLKQSRYLLILMPPVSQQKKGI